MSEAVKPAPGADILSFMRTPYNLEAETALLGAILVNNDVYEHVSGWLKGDHFYEQLHGRIYDAACALIEKGRAATPISLKPFFEDDENIDEGLSVPRYIRKLVSQATTIINAKEYATAIQEHSQLRDLMALAGDISRRAATADYTDCVDDQIEDAESALYEIGEEGGRLSTVASFSEVLRGAITNIDAAWRRGDGLAGLSTGIGPVDDLTGGLADTDLIVIAGRPSMGKTTLAVNMAYEIAERGDPVAFFSLEMSNDQLGQKILATKTGVPTDSMRRGKINESQFRRLIEVSRQKNNLPLFIDQQGALTVAQLTMRARRMKRKMGIKAVFIDYLGLMVSKGWQNNKVQQISDITNGLKALAKELRVPVVVLSQLSREVEKRVNKRPMLSDLRDSGSIEQDADVVLFVYREDYYHERDKPDIHHSDYTDWASKMNAIKGHSEVIAAKQRHGPIGTAKLLFNDKRSVFHDPDVALDNEEVLI